MQNAVTGGKGRDDNVGEQTARRPDPDGKFFTEINNTVVKFADATPSGERILDKADLKPTKEHVLIQLNRHGTRSVGLDETVDLRAPGTERFQAFKSDRIYRFTLDEHGFEWGTDKIPEPDLRRIAHIAGDDVLVLRREGEDMDLKPTDVLDLAQNGTEHLYTEKRFITVYFENEPRQIRRGSYTTEELKQLFGVQEGYILEVIDEEGKLTPLKPGRKLRVKPEMKFFEQVPCGGSS